MTSFMRIALVSAVAIAASSSVVRSQEKPATFGGDVTADEAAALPSVVVESPTVPIAKSSRKRSKSSGYTPASTAGPAPSATTAYEQDGFADSVPTSGGNNLAGSAGIFTLGQLDLIGGSTVTNEAMWTFNTQSLDQAVALAPGVSAFTTGGRRNERNIYVRGFDRFRVPLSIDGVRVYLPADNRLDMNRFLTPDLAEVQIQKGYVSVLNGPGGMGGAINMVSRKPTKEVELEGRAGMVMNGDLDSLNQWNAYAFAGTRQKGYYAQISGTIVDQDHFNLSHDFNPAGPANDPSFPYEQGGNRDWSDFRDWRINVKAGITPNATDEYSINYTTQSGQKNAPLHIAQEQLQTQRYWTWPYWDISSLSWLSKTQLGELSYVKTNVYYNTFQNRLSSFDVPVGLNLDPVTKPPFSQQTFPYAFNSDYDDFAYGGSVEFGTDIIPYNTLKAAIHYRHDNHSERNFNRPDHPTMSSVEPWQQNVEDTWSVALENTFHITKRLDFITGVSWDYNDVITAEDFSGGVVVPNKTVDADAWNYQGGLIYNYSNTGSVHTTVSSRTRFPTVFERYSTRFGYATPNPDLAPERSTNYEIGASELFFNKARVSGAIFYSDLKDAIQSAYIITGSGSVSSQNQNVDGKHYGIELSVDWELSPGLRVGGNYTYLERDYDYLTPGTKPEGTPRHEAFLYLSWDATPKLTITPSLALASDLNSIVTSGTTRTYIETGSYALANIQAEYKINDKTSAAIGATNIFDENYSLTEGFPEAGRQFFANVRARF